MPFSTSIITNTRASGTASSNIVVNTRNLSTTTATTVTLEIFASVNSSSFYTAYALTYVVPADSYDVREFFIAGNVAYEVQMSTTVSQVLFSVFGLDEFGNMVANQGKTQAELSFISSLSPLMV